MHNLAERHGSQFIIATHSPLLMAYPGARLYLLGPGAIASVDYEETEHFRVTRDFLAHRELYFKHLFDGD